ncbi:uncharacterized protein [Littorina saxatilis]|uniref:uncharacterized protein isoform X2 n=1 Tax=Littorina saxatilis TaxID=31220 RepID=UPI0038B52633
MSADAESTSPVTLGSHAKFHFTILTYNNITSCILRGPGNDGIHNCKGHRSDVDYSGVLPQLSLTLWIRDVRKEDEGTWQLTVTNGFSEPAKDNFTLRAQPFPTEPPQTSTFVSAFIGVVGFLVIVIVVLVFLVVFFRKKSQRKGAVSRTRNADIQGDGPSERVSGHSYEEVPDATAPLPPRCHQHGQGQTSRPGRSPAAPTRPAVDSQPDDYLHPVNNQTASSGTNQSADAPATPGGPYDSLEMSDVGLRSPYSQLGM